MLTALTHKGFTAPTSIQNIALPRLLAESGHLIVKARTGTGKTAAFGIPLIEQIRSGGRIPRALILTPTRELALQISREIASLCSGPFPRITAVYGGASIRSQIMDLKRGVEIAVGTPGRVMDLMERKILDLSSIGWFILDEADEMLDMGFLEDVEKILASVKPERRVALFSATMPEAILKVVRQYIGNVEILEDAAPEEEKPAVDQYYMILKREDKLEALRRIIDSSVDFYGLVFCATKHETDELARRLTEDTYSAEAIHGDLSQEARERTLRRFRSKQTRILVATDVAARGLDIERLTHVVNWDLPQDRETYIHRIGRTGRAGRRGMAISLALPLERERIGRLSHSMERTLGGKIEFTKAPTVKTVMKAMRNRITESLIAILPPVITEQAPVDTENAAIALPVLAEQQGEAESQPYVAKVCRQLIENLGAERAVEALVAQHYGDMLDPTRYSTITEFAEIIEAGRRDQGKRGVKYNAESRERFVQRGSRRSSREQGPFNRSQSINSSDGRVYVGLGRKHGASARDIAVVLSKAAGIPTHLIDAIELKDFCAFANLPPDAARRACAAQTETAIRMAAEKKRG